MKRPARGAVRRGNAFAAPGIQIYRLGKHFFIILRLNADGVLGLLCLSRPDSSAMNTAAAETAERAYKRARKAWRSDKEV
eukprot:1002370-Amorphochlora_amoeboformis.AAC.1